MTLEELYRAVRTDGAAGEAARQLLEQTHWFTVNVEFDPKTGDALPLPLSVFLSNVARQLPDGRTQDRLFRISEHARSAVERLFRTLSESPRREHANLPPHKVRELDASSFSKLTTRPGRNIREKLAGKPYLQAVRRFQSVNLPENRLLKSCVSRLAELLRLRSTVLGEPNDDLLPKIELWLLSDEAGKIGKWDNLPPNNTLLAHRDYRRVWDAWRRLQRLDDDIARDLSCVHARRETMKRWMNFGRMFRDGTHVFADMPVLFDYEGFTIQTWYPEPIFRIAAQTISRSCSQEVTKTAVCLDLAAPRPQFSSADCGTRNITEKFLWQQWKNAAVVVDVPLFAADAVYLHQDACTITAQDLFFPREGLADNLLERAARVFCDRLRESFKDDRVYWLAPDAINDFDLDIVRRSLNARFSRAEPLPRSVAALFEAVDYNQITKDGYAVLVVESLGGITCATKLVARFDAELEKRLPETNGYYWERCPPIILSRDEPLKERRYSIPTVDADGAWHNSARSDSSRAVNQSAIKENKGIGEFHHRVDLSGSPVAGGIRLHALQERAGDIPLWRDRIPELSIKVLKDGRPHRFYLVSRGTTVKPIRGLSVQIPIKKRFTLPAGSRFYQFPLFQGENADEIRFSARLDSQAFPLQSDVVCDTILTFQYGDDEPYSLTFVPTDKSFQPVRASWQRTAEETTSNAPSPAFPPPDTWDGLRRVKKPNGESSDFLEWCIRGFDRVDLTPHSKPRSVGSLKTGWIEDVNGRHYAFAQCDGVAQDVFLHESNFVRIKGVDYGSFGVGDQLTFELKHQGARVSGVRVAPAGRPYSQVEDDVIDKMRPLFVPFLRVWRDGRSIRDGDCPAEFARAAVVRIEEMERLVLARGLSQRIKDNLMGLLCSLHRDAPDVCVKWMLEQVASRAVRHPGALGNALGDVELKWQKDIFHAFASHPNEAAIVVFAHAVWRQRDFIKQFTLGELETLLPVLLQGVAGLQPRPAYGGTLTIAGRPLELLLGLLRTRESDDARIRMILQPHQKLTKQFAEQIERIAELDVRVFSRVKIEGQKEGGGRELDLLHALGLYLTGDDGANAIHITGVEADD